MRCHDAIGLLSRCRDGDLDAARRAELERHLAACPRCRDEFAAVEAALACLHELPLEAAPPGLTAAVSARLQTRVERPRAVLLRWAVPVAGAALLVAVSFGIMRAWPPRETPRAAVVAAREPVAEEGAAEMGAPADIRAPEPEKPKAVSPLAESIEPAPPAPAAAHDRPDEALPRAVTPAPPPAAGVRPTEPRGRDFESPAADILGAAESAPRMPAPERRIAPTAEPRGPAGPAGVADETSAREAPPLTARLRAAPEAFVNVTARATPSQVAGNALTLEIHAEGAAADAEVVLQADTAPEVVLWRGRVERRASNLDVQLPPPSTRQQLIVRGPQGATAYNLYAPPAAPSAMAAREATEIAPRTWDSVLQQMAARQRAYVLAPRDFPAERPADLGPSPAPKTVEKALQGIGYQLRAEDNVINIERAPAAAKPGAERKRQRR